MKINDVPQSGSVAGVTSSRNRSGQYRRTRAVPVNPNTVAQSGVRSRLASLAAAWRTLTAEAQLGWVAYANAHPRTNPIGTTYVLTGMQAYVGVNGELGSAGLALVDVAPESDTPDAPVIAEVSATVGSLEIGYAPTPVPALTKMVVQASVPKSRGILYNSDYRTVKIVAAAAASPVEITAAYEEKFGIAYGGKRIFVRAKLITADGQSGSWSNVLMLDIPVLEE